MSALKPRVKSKGERTGRGAHRASAAPRTEAAADGDGEAAHRKAPYEPTPKERATIDAFHQRMRARKPSPALKLTGDDGISVAHPDSKVGGTLAIESLGLSDGETYGALVHQIINAASKGKALDLPAVNGMLGMIQALEPRDTLEAMLTTQMAAVHYATMTFARRLNHVENLPQQDSASNAFNKLARTFAAQVEALNRNRGKGQQAIRVEHVTVAPGGQAIVGSNVYPQGGGDSAKKEKQAHAQVTHAPVTPLPSQDAQREPMPIAQGEGEETLPHAWGR